MSIDRITAHRVVVARGLHEDRRCRDRLERMLTCIDAETVETVDDSELRRILEAYGRREDLERGGLERRCGPKALVAFTGFNDEPFPGYAWNEMRDGARERDQNGVLCHSAVEVQSAVGCAYDCTYCPYGPFLCVNLDVEGFVDRVGALARSRTCQSLFKLNNRSDTLALEPEYGLAAALVERFADLDDKYLMLYSKGDAIEHLVHLDHRGKTVASFTLTPPEVAHMLETDAPSPSARICAIGRMARAGYPIRVRFSPIVPIRGWRAAYRTLLSRLTAVATPEMITLWTLSMVDFENLARIVPLEDLDEAALAAAEEHADAMRGKKGAPFPPDLRASIYRELAEITHEVSPSTHVALCLETEQVWNQASPLLRREDGLLCNCGPLVTPEALARAGLARAG